MNNWGGPPEHRQVDLPPGGSKSYLRKGLAVCRGIMESYGGSWHAASSYGDMHGTYTYTANIRDMKIGEFKLQIIARKSILGKIVGAGVPVVERCIGENRNLLIYINMVNKIYRFDAYEAKSQGTFSTRGGQTYYDFPIILGIDLMKYLDSLHNPDRKEGLQDYLDIK